MGGVVSALTGWGGDDVEHYSLFISWCAETGATAYSTGEAGYTGDEVADESSYSVVSA